MSPGGRGRWIGRLARRPSAAGTDKETSAPAQPRAAARAPLESSQGDGQVSAPPGSPERCPVHLTALQLPHPLPVPGSPLAPSPLYRLVCLSLRPSLSRRATSGHRLGWTRGGSPGVQGSCFRSWSCSLSMQVSDLGRRERGRGLGAALGSHSEQTRVARDARDHGGRSEPVWSPQAGAEARARALQPWA